MGQDLNKFYRYPGSLTTPTCTENVIWTVFEEPVVFNDDKLLVFRTSLFTENFREPQPLNGRIVYRNFVDPTTTSISDYSICTSDPGTSTSTQSTTLEPLNGNSILLINTQLFIYSMLFLLQF